MSREGGARSCEPSPTKGKGLSVQAAALRLRPQNMKCFEEALQRTVTELWKAEKCKRVVAQTDDDVAGSGTADQSPNALASRQPALLLLEVAKRRMASGLQLLLREDDLDNHPSAARAVSGNRVEPVQDAVEFLCRVCTRQ